MSRMNEDARYPIGKFQWKGGTNSEAERQRLMGEIEAAPGRLRAALAGLSQAQLDTPYREGGWTLRQVAHHVPDSHMNAYIRCKWALTEENPTIKAYEQERWAELGDTRGTPVETSLALLESLHQRWVVLLRGLKPEEWQRTFIHPETGKAMSLDMVLAMYAWHGAHHAAHVTGLRKKMKW